MDACSVESSQPFAPVVVPQPAPPLGGMGGRSAPPPPPPMQGSLHPDGKKEQKVAASDRTNCQDIGWCQ
eukprot:3627074-Lingulodinium_polyedra.AAC.1